VLSNAASSWSRQPAPVAEGVARSAGTAGVRGSPAGSGFVRGFGALFGDRTSLDPQEAQAQWELLSHNGGHRIMHRLCAYLDERVRYCRPLARGGRRVARPAGVPVGAGRPVATGNVLAGLRELRPAAEVVELPGIGHYLAA
jgi:hypothetical protein